VSSKPVLFDYNGVVKPKPIPLSAGTKDTPTVTTDGQSKLAKIHDVIAHQPPIHSDHRGELVEMFTTPEFWESEFAYAYQTSIRPGMLKGWFAHEKKLDRYHIVRGELLLLLYDGREESPTCGVVQKILLSDRSARQVLIPQKVWHLSLNVGQDDAILVNLPSTCYDHENPDRFHIAFDSGTIPVDVQSFFPVTFVGAQDAAARFC
jgi:dTDP-4-dehydrorhamnose 3,5-epimerase